ncbi:MAG: aldo/keto reductase [Mycobacteriales bacterium]
MAGTDGGRASARRRLGGTGVEVSALSVGTAPLGNLFRAVSDADAAATVEAALGAGLRYFDTAPLYGHGLAERRVGTALRGRRDVVLSTKVGRLLRPAEGVDGGVFDIVPDAVPVFDFSGDGVRRSLEESLQRLGLDHVDVVYLHDPDDHVRQALDEAYPALHELRAAGVVKAIGVGMNGPAVPTRFVRETELDALILAGRYTLLDRTGARELIAACRERGTSIIAAAVLNSGILVDPRPGATFDYEEAPPALLERAQRIERICRAYGVPLRAAALQFALGEPVVASVLTGMRSPAEVADNVAMMDLPIPTQLWKDLIADGLIDDWVSVSSESVASS